MQKATKDIIQKVAGKTSKLPENSSLLKTEVTDVQYGGISESSVQSSDAQPDASECRRCLGFVKGLTIEPVMFAFMSAYMIIRSCMTNMVMDKYCLYRLNYTEEVCYNLSHYKDVKTEVEIFANDFMLYSNFVTLLGAIAIVFVAPWSDKYGRKPPLILAFTGMLVADVGMVMCVLKFESRLEYIILARVPSELFGGMICILTIVYSHASEVTTSKKRTIKYTTVEIGFGTGLSLGGLFGGLLYKYYGYLEVYLCATALHLFCVLWTLLVVKETRGLDTSSTWKKKLCDLFSFQNLADGFKTCIKARDNDGRRELWLLIGSICAIVLTYESVGSIGYVFVHHIYNWNPTLYQEVMTVFMMTSFVITLICMPLFIKVYRFPDCTIGMIGTTSLVLKNTILAFAAYRTWIYYLGNAAGFLGSVSPLAVRSRVSKLVEKDEIGQVFSFLAICEAAVPVVSTVVITLIFNATIDIFPCITYLVVTSFMVLPLYTFIWEYYRRRNAALRLPSESSINSEVKA